MDRGATTPASPLERPRPRSRGISFNSDKSGGSSDRRSKLVESPREKAQRDSIWKGQSKANPNAAINEAQPAVFQANEQSTLANLRELDHKDGSGNVIADPDRSNPTRPRMERPLDTIRNFERAIEDGHRRRTSYLRQESSEQWDKDNQYASRRSSYFGGSDNGQNPGQNYHRGSQSQGGYHGGQSYYNNAPPRTRYASNRMQSDPQLYGHRPHAQHGYHQSHDTVNTGMTNGSDSTGPWANSTDPSSENSSLDRVNAMNKPGDQYANYGANGYNGTIMEEQNGMHGEYRQQGRDSRLPSNGDNGYAQQNGYGANGYAQQNGHGPNGYTQASGSGQPNGYDQRDSYQRSYSNPQQPVRRPIQLGGSSSGAPATRPPVNYAPQAREEPVEKRKSWLKRRFSRNS